MLPIKLILCPTDFSGPSATCVRTAAELAEHFGAELLLVNVVPAVPSLPPDPNYVFKIPEYERYLHADAEEQLRKAREELVGKNVKVRTQVGHGSAADEIVLIAKADQVPSNSLAAAHGETIEIAIEQSVDGVFLVALLELAVFLPDRVRRGVNRPILAPR